jgi:hypothetical protein
MIAAAQNFPNFTVLYVPATSNSGAHYLANMGGFSVSSPPLSAGWNFPVQ